MDTLTIQTNNNKKVYFASDVHLGLYPEENSRKREKLFVHWLDSIKGDAQALFLLGDIFDFWWEYWKVVPRGFTRFLGKICELTDNGVEVHFFTGNHDVWVFDYLPKETGMIIHHNPIKVLINNKTFYLGHGDVLGFEDRGYRFLKACFNNKVLQWFYSRLHPNLAMAIGHVWSKNSRYSKGVAEPFFGEDKEHQILYARKHLQSEPIDFFVFGHRHIPLDYKLSEASRLINLGEWIHANTYAVFDGKEMKLGSFTNTLLH
jgi:UDP-2,3-diacylglucosamine hydrolase